MARGGRGAGHRPNRARSSTASRAGIRACPVPAPSKRSWPRRTLYAADPERLFLFGHSKGGIAAQVRANRTVTPWKAVGLHAGTLPADAVVPARTAVPVRHDLGSVDRVLPFGPARDGAEALARAGHPVDLVRREGHNHWFYDMGQAIAADAWTWMAQVAR